MTLFVTRHPTVTTHIRLFTKSQWYQARTGVALGTPNRNIFVVRNIFSNNFLQFDMLCSEDMVHVDVEFGSPLLELALLGGLDWYQVVVEAASLVDLQHEAALLRVVRLVGHVGDGRHVAQAAPIVIVAQDSSSSASPAQL